MAEGAGGDGRRQRWQAHREARRAEMVQAAIRAIRRCGAGVGMEDIAAEAGVTKPVLYRYFADRTDLYVAVGGWAAQDLLAKLAPRLEGVHELRHDVAAMINEYLLAIETEPELYRFVTSSALADRRVENDLVNDYRKLIAAGITRVIGERMRAFGIDSGAAEPWGHGLVGMVQAAGDWWLDRRTMSRESLTEYLTDLIWAGFLGKIKASSAQPGGAVLRLARNEEKAGDG